MPQCLALVRELKMKPHIYFNSNIDSPEEWRAALSQHFPNMKYSVGEVCEEPLVWKLPNRGLSSFKNLKAVLSLGAGINQLDPDKLPKDVPLARLVDDSLTQTMIEYAKAATFRYHRKFHLFERQSREAQWTFLPATLAQETSVGILGLGDLKCRVGVERQKTSMILQPTLAKVVCPICWQARTSSSMCSR
jgi:glyoxylate/hydroxypyruvate reductase A